LKKIFLIIFVFYSFFFQAQTTDSIYTASGFLKIKNNKDSTPYNKDYFFNEGIYLSYQDFRQCNAVPRALILTKIEKNQLEFYHKLVDLQDTIVYRKGKGISLISTDQLFCFVQNNFVYLNVEGTFCRIPVFGNISHFIGNISIEAFRSDGPFYDPSMNGASGITGNPLRAKETREFIFDFYYGKTLLMTPENLEVILKRDINLFKEFSKLTKKQKRKKLYYFLKRYNDLHSANFPKA
jgi:hypothetical protein